MTTGRINQGASCARSASGSLEERAVCAVTAAGLASRSATLFSVGSSEERAFRKDHFSLMYSHSPMIAVVSRSTLTLDRLSDAQTSRNKS